MARWDHNKKNVPSTCSRKFKKVPPAVSKHGLYGVIVAEYSNAKKKNNSSASASASKPPEPIVIVETANADTPAASATPNVKQVRRGTVFFLS